MKFKPEDFEIDYLLHACCAEIANVKLLEIKKQWLEELVKDAPEIYGRRVRIVDMVDDWQWDHYDDPNTYKGRVVCIEKL